MKKYIYCIQMLLIFLGGFSILSGSLPVFAQSNTITCNEITNITVTTESTTTESDYPFSLQTSRQIRTMLQANTSSRSRWKSERLHPQLTISTNRDTCRLSPGHSARLWRGVAVPQPHNAPVCPRSHHSYADEAHLRHSFFWIDSKSLNQHPNLPYIIALSFKLGQSILHFLIAFSQSFLV